jgi:hypothetical protein
MKQIHHEEIAKNRLRLSDSKIKDLLSRPGVTPLDRNIVDGQAHDIDNERGAADTFGYHFNDQTKGVFDGFYVKYNGSLYQRGTLIEVGWLLDAFEHEEDERQDLKS